MGDQKPKKIAVIDIGTNSVLLLIAEITKNNIKKLYDISKISKLGENLIHTGYLNNDAIKRTIDILMDYYKLIKKFNTDNIYIIGTMALRNAKNKNEFLNQVKEKFNWEIKIIEGEKEAYYTFLSIKYDKKIQFNNFIVIDVGGGSTEFIVTKNNKIFDKKSINIGAVVIKDKFFKNDLPTINELNDARIYIKNILHNTIKQWDLPLIGNGGTITTLAAVNLKLDQYNSNIIHGYKLHKNDIKNLLKLFLSLELNERKNIKGLQPKRADIIIPGTLIIDTILEYFNKNIIYTSDLGIRYGILYEKLYG